MAAGSPTADSRAVNSAPSSPPSTSSTTAAVNADTEMGTGSTPKTSKRGRRSFIPTPSHVSMCVTVCIELYREREREREGASGGGSDMIHSP
ncbi:MAG: hypothetical protein MJE68_19555 [Proteobacteria bacterium]|nr:hypothetical protein [Pseudomonadota bacterium]